MITRTALGDVTVLGLNPTYMSYPVCALPRKNEDHTHLNPDLVVGPVQKA